MNTNASSKVLFFFKFVILFSGLFIISITLGNIFFDASMRIYDGRINYSFTGFNSVFLCVSIIVTVLLINRDSILKFSNRYGLQISSIIILITSFFFIFVINPKLGIDAEDIMNEAVFWAQNKQFSPNYLQMLPYQFGIVHLLYLLVVVFGSETSAILAIRLINVFSLLVINLYIFKLIKLLNYEKYAGIACLLLSMLLFPSALTTYVYGDLLGYCLAFVSLYYSILLITKWSTKILGIQLITLFFGVYFRLPTLIFAVAQIIIWLCLSKNKIKYMVVSLVLVVTFLAKNSGEYILQIFYNLDTFNIPMLCRFTMGFDIHNTNASEPGWFSGYIYELYGRTGGNQQLMLQSSLEYLSEIFNYFVKNPRFFLEFMCRKFYSTWLLPDFETDSVLRLVNNINYTFMNFALPGSIIMFWYHYFSSVIFMLITIFSCFGIYYGFHHKEKLVFVFALLFLGGISYHLIGEVKARYNIPYVLCLIPLAVYGYKYLFIKEVGSQYKSKKIISLFSMLLVTFISVNKMTNTYIPILKFQSYTDTKELIELVKGDYYQIDLKVESDIDLKHIEILMNYRQQVQPGQFLLVEVIDTDGNILGSASHEIEFLQNEVWEQFVFDKEIVLNTGDYKIQVSSSNETSIGLSLVVGKQYSYVNQEDMLHNGFTIDCCANYKVFKNI